MPHRAKITNYTVYVSASSGGFNEWRRNMWFNTDEQGIHVSLRFVEGDATGLPEQVREDGISLLYLPVEEFDTVLHLLQTEEPVYVTLYGSSNNALIHTGQESPGDQEIGI